MIYDAAVTRELGADFHTDLEHCVVFTDAEYEARKATSRLLDSSLRLFSPLL